MQHQKRMKNYLKWGIVILAVIAVVLVIIKVIKPKWLQGKYKEIQSAAVDASQPDMDVQLLDINQYSRPGIESNKITGIVVHYTANPGASAQNNRDYFQSLSYTHETSASSHFIVGLEGEIIQCVPTWEIAYASNERNADTVSIETCHPDETGEFTTETYHSLVQLTAWLCLKFGLSQEDVIRHYDVTGKNCPKYYVENEAEWEQFKQFVGEAIEKSE